MREKILLLTILLVYSVVTAAQEFVIEASYYNKKFIINGESIEAKTFCFDVEQGDKVIFIGSRRTGDCGPAEFLNLRTGNICEASGKACVVWCE